MCDYHVKFKGLDDGIYLFHVFVTALDLLDNLGVIQRIYNALFTLTYLTICYKYHLRSAYHLSVNRFRVIHSICNTVIRRISYELFYNL